MQPAGTILHNRDRMPATRTPSALIIGTRRLRIPPGATPGQYELAARLGAGLLEPDLVSTRDGVLVARHEPEIGGTTDVSARPEFAGRRTAKQIDGQTVAGWFTEDFNPGRAAHPARGGADSRAAPGQHRFDGRYPVPTSGRSSTWRSG